MPARKMLRNPFMLLFLKLSPWAGWTHTDTNTQHQQIRCSDSVWLDQLVSCQRKYPSHLHSVASQPHGERRRTVWWSWYEYFSVILLSCFMRTCFRTSHRSHSGLNVIYFTNYVVKWSIRGEFPTERLTELKSGLFAIEQMRFPRWGSPLTGVNTHGFLSQLDQRYKAVTFHSHACWH